MGDVHGDWAGLNTFLDNKIRKSPQVAAYKKRYDELEIVILQVGDFGYWPHRRAINDSTIIRFLVLLRKSTSLGKT
ncbi:MAG: hypothetical protein LBR82_08530 [Desulfovibrio sp.]|jgi:hypothetical protein|nr:hypothetical protein [Desulfovibrio sp.]